MEQHGTSAVDEESHQWQRDRDFELYKSWERNFNNRYDAFNNNSRRAQSIHSNRFVRVMANGGIFVMFYLWIMLVVNDAFGEGKVTKVEPFDDRNNPNLYPNKAITQNDKVSFEEKHKFSQIVPQPKIERTDE